MFDLQYITFGVTPHVNQEEEVCECCPKLKRRFTKKTKIHAPYFCGNQNCGNSVCEDCVVCYSHSYYKCELPGCEEDTYWNECIFGDEVLVSYNSCFENFLKDFAIE
jgi:hypothetical protein